MDANLTGMTPEDVIQQMSFAGRTVMPPSDVTDVHDGGQDGITSNDTIVPTGTIDLFSTPGNPFGEPLAR